MIQKYIAILITLVFIFSLFTPGIMAQANEKSILNEMVIPTVDMSKMSSLSKEDVTEIETLIYMMLEMDGIRVENLDLSNMKNYENNLNLEIAGNISYTINNKEYTSMIYSKYDLENQSFETISKTDESYNKVTIKPTSESNEMVTYSIDTTYIRDGRIQKNTEYISSEKNSISNEISNEKGVLKTRGWEHKLFDLPSKPPALSVRIINDMKLSNILNVASAAIAIAGVFTGGTVTSAALLICSLATVIVSMYFDNLTDINLSEVFVDIYSMVTWILYTPPIGVYGLAIGAPTGFIYPGLYMEVDYYYRWVYV